MATEGEVRDSSAVAEGGAAGMIVHIRCSNGSKLSVEISLDMTVGAFKVILAGRCDVPAEQQRLIYKGRILKDEQTLGSYGVESDHTLHLVRGAASTPASTDARVDNHGASRASSNTSGTGRDVNSNQPGNLGGTLFPGLGFGGQAGTGASSRFGIAFPDMEQMHRQLIQNPNMMTELLNMPAVQNLMSNPELMRNLITNNPQMQDIIDRNPEFAHVLNDPSILRQTLDVARNPELMREMMRNTDRAMSNIESSPEGFNMLRRMYENVQEPLLNATTISGDSGNNPLDSNPFAALLGNISGNQNPVTGSNTELQNGSPAPNVNPLPNPWSNTPGGGQPNNTRSTATNARPPAFPGLSPDMANMLGSFPDSTSAGEALQNPALMQWIQRMLSNPQQLNQVLGINSHVQNLAESDPELRAILQNPEFLQQIANPEAMRQLLSVQQSLLSQLLQQPNPEQNQARSGTAQGLDSLIGLFGGLGAGGLGVPNNVPPEERYATQLSQLQEMGFFDTQENIRALTATAGNVHAAVERLLGNTDR